MRVFIVEIHEGDPPDLNQVTDAVAKLTGDPKRVVVTEKEVDRD